MPMKLPQEFLPKYKDLERAELLLFLPAEWDILTGYETDADVPDRLWWPVRLMKYLARFPHEFKTWLGWGHTLPNSADCVPYDESTKLCGAMLGALQENISMFRTEDDTQINMYCVIPLYKEDCGKGQFCGGSLGQKHSFDFIFIFLLSFNESG